MLGRDIAELVLQKLNYFPLPRNVSLKDLCVGKGHCGISITKAHSFFLYYLYAVRKAITQKEGIYFRCFKMCNAYGAVYIWYNKGLHCCTDNPRGVLRKM